MLAGIVAAVWMLVAALAGSNRAWQIAVAYDQLGNATFGGYVDETISARTFRANHSGKLWGVILYRLLNFLQPGHCEMAYQSEVLREGLPAEERAPEGAGTGARLLRDSVGSG